MRLIDADALEKAGLIMVKLSDKEDKLLTKFEWKDVPTAYDVEAKVAELEKYAEENKGERMQDGIGSCVRIVRGKE